MKTLCLKVSSSDIYAQTRNSFLLLNNFIVKKKNEFISIFSIFPLFCCQALMTHAKASPYADVLISSWNQVDLFKMFSGKSLEKELAAIWVEKRSEFFCRTHTEIILDLWTWSSSMAGSDSFLFSDTEKRSFSLGPKKSCFSSHTATTKSKQGPKEYDKSSTPQSFHGMDTVKMHFFRI